MPRGDLRRHVTPRLRFDDHPSAGERAACCIADASARRTPRLNSLPNIEDWPASSRCSARLRHDPPGRDGLVCGSSTAHEDQIEVTARRASGLHEGASNEAARSGVLAGAAIVPRAGRAQQASARAVSAI